MDLMNKKILHEKMDVISLRKALSPALCCNYNRPMLQEE
jgi:hypothetical protein